MSVEALTKLCDRRLQRSSKPRSNGTTGILDTGIGTRRIADLLEVSGAHVDVAKIAWGSSLITGHLVEKLVAYRSGDVEPMLGGTLFEYAYLRGQVDALLDAVRDLHVSIEISDGVAEVPNGDKLRWIERFAVHTKVVSEVGGKGERQDRDWKRLVTEQLAAGASAIVVEGREIGPVGEPIREGFVDAIVDAAGGADNLVFEALERGQQLWLIQRFGPNVNLANIRPDDVLTLESFRQGLKEHTLLSMWNLAQRP